MPKPKKKKRTEILLKKKLLREKAEFEEQTVRLRVSRPKFKLMLRVSSDGTVTGSYWDIIREMPDYLCRDSAEPAKARPHYNPLRGVK